MTLTGRMVGGGGTVPPATATGAGKQDGVPAGAPAGSTTLGDAPPGMDGAGAIMVGSTPGEHAYT